MKLICPPPAEPTIPIDDPWRQRLRIPVFGTMALALGFFLYTAPLKETPPVFDHAPWLNDPFDTVISFMMFFVPLMALACVPRILLCRRHEPLPASRIRDILRGCRVVAAGSTLTLAVEWISVGIMDNHRAWNTATAFQIALLAVMSAADLLLVVRLGRTGLPTISERSAHDVAAYPDWLGDGLSFVRQHDRWFGPLRQPVRSALERVAGPLEALFRRHPLLIAATAAALFGVGVGVIQGVREAYTAGVMVTASALLALGMFGLIVVAGRYLELVHSSQPLCGVRRRLIDAAVVTCIGVLVPFALRYHLWWVVGATNATASIQQLVELLLLAAGLIFGAAFAGESILGLHSAAPAPKASDEKTTGRCS